MRRLLAPALAALLLWATASARSDPAEADFPPGPAIGDEAPGFSLPATSGETRTLASLLTPGRRLAVLFFRSADW